MRVTPQAIAGQMGHDSSNFSEVLKVISSGINQSA